MHFQAANNAKIVMWLHCREAVYRAMYIEAKQASVPLAYSVRL
jgi:hypothetical protein